MTESLYVHTITGPITELSPEELGIVLTALRAQANGLRAYAARYCMDHPDDSVACTAFKEIVDRMDSVEHKLFALTEESWKSKPKREPVQ